MMNMETISLWTDFWGIEHPLCLQMSYKVKTMKVMWRIRALVLKVRISTQKVELRRCLRGPGCMVGLTGTEI
jgi:hypothetical protein